MIKSFADKRTAAVFAGLEAKRMAKPLQKAARRKLMMLDAVSGLDTLAATPGNRLEALKGDRKGQCSIRIDGQWRLCFLWEAGHAWGVEIVDYPEEPSVTIKREELRNIDLASVATGRRLAPVRPGEVLLKEFIEPMRLTRYKVAKGTGVPQRRIDEICSGSRGMTADTALRLGRFFGVEAQFWMNLQARYDLEVAERGSHKRIEREVTPLKQAA